MLILSGGDCMKWLIVVVVLVVLWFLFTLFYIEGKCKPEVEEWSCESIVCAEYYHDKFKVGVGHTSYSSQELRDCVNRGFVYE